jgi:hypothetical protein
MTWRYRIFRKTPGEYSLHAVNLDENGKPRVYHIAPETFDFGESCEFYGNDQEAREHMISLLTKALEDATHAPMMTTDENGVLLEADPV